MKIGAVIQLVELRDLRRALTLLFHLLPSTPEAYKRLGEAVRLYRKG